MHAKTLSGFGSLVAILKARMRLLGIFLPIKSVSHRLVGLVTARGRSSAIVQPGASMVVVPPVGTFVMMIPPLVVSLGWQGTLELFVGAGGLAANAARSGSKESLFFFVHCFFLLKNDAVTCRLQKNRAENVWGG